MPDTVLKRLHIIGRKNSGKTTLIVDLVTEFTMRGYRVGTIKHTHHNHELDTPGKDSHRHRQAGSTAVGILSPAMNAIFWPQPSEQSSSAKYNLFDASMNQCDLILVEGDSQTTAPKIEVFRTATSEQPMAVADRTIHAVVTDDELDIGTATLKRSDLNSIVVEIEKLLQFAKA